MKKSDMTLCRSFNTVKWPVIVYYYIRIALHSSPTYDTVTRCNFSCNLQRNSTLKRCQLVKNVQYVKKTLAKCNQDACLPTFYLSIARTSLQIARKIASCDSAFS